MSDPGDMLTEKRREEIIDDVVRSRSTGARIPIEFSLKGKIIPVKSVITQLLVRKEEGAITPADRRMAQELASQVRTKIRQQLQRVRAADVTASEGERIAGECAGLDKALDVLESIGKRLSPRKIRTGKVDDMRRWLEFGKRISGRR